MRAGPAAAHGLPGMTLLEVVVALTVVGLVLAAGYVAFGQITDHRRRAADATDAVVRPAVIRASLRGWLAGARLVADEGGPPFRGLDGIAGDLADDRIAFLTSARTPLGAAPALVRIAVDRDAETPERGLVADFAEWRGTRRLRVEIAPQAVGLEVRYLSGVPGERRWLPSWVSSTVLPAGLELTLVAAADDSLPPLLALPLRVPLGGR